MKGERNECVGLGLNAERGWMGAVGEKGECINSRVRSVARDVKDFSGEERIMKGKTRLDTRQPKSLGRQLGSAFRSQLCFGCEKYG